MDKKDLILDTARQLFNESGTAAVSTNHMAEALGISSGNLYYHFRNKEEIIRAIFEQLFQAWDAAFNPTRDQDLTLDDLQHFVQANFSIMWEYRFVYRELIALLRRDPVLQSRFQDVRQRGFAGFSDLFAAFVRAGILRPPDDSAEVTYLAELCWLISEFWLPTVEIGGQTVDAQQMQHGVKLMMQVLRPYVQ